MGELGRSWLPAAVIWCDIERGLYEAVAAAAPRLVPEGESRGFVEAA